MVLFTAEPGRAARALGLATAFSALLALLAGYVGWQATPVGAFDVEALYAVYIITLLAAVFIALAYLRLVVVGEPIRYPALFAGAWRNLLVAALAAAMLGGVAILLVLAAALFATLGVHVLTETFEKPWFFLPGVAIAFGIGVLVFRARQGLIDSIVGLLESLARYLLPLVLAIVLAFLLTLPFVSLQALWDTGSGSLILIALNVIAVVLVIVAYRPGGQAPYAPFIHLPVAAGVALLPVVAALALLGIVMRVEQYGWTVARAWAFTGACILALFSVGYAVAVGLKRAEWPSGMAPVNTAMGYVLLGVLLLVNSPILDFRSISAASQLARVESGAVAAAEFDFRYAREMLARPGFGVAQRLIEQLGFDPLAEGSAQGAIYYDADAANAVDRAAVSEEFWQSIQFRGEPFEIPDGVRAAIDAEPFLLRDLEQLMLAQVDLDGDPARREYLVLGVRRFEIRARADVPAMLVFNPQVFAVADAGSGWNVHVLSASGGGGQLPGDAAAVVEALRRAEIERLPRRYDDFRIGDRVYGFPPGAGWLGASAPEAAGDAPR